MNNAFSVQEERCDEKKARMHDLEIEPKDDCDHLENEEAHEYCPKHRPKRNQRIYRQAQAQALTKSLPLVARTALSNGLTSVRRVCLLMA